MPGTPFFNQTIMSIDPKLIPYPEEQPKKKKNILISSPWIARILGGVIFVFLFAIIGFFIFFNTVGESFLERKLSKSLKRPVQINFLRVIMPFGLAADDIDVGGVIRVKAARVWLNLPSLLWLFGLIPNSLINRFRLTHLNNTYICCK